MTSIGIQSGDLLPPPDTDISHILKRLEGTEMHVKELVDHIKKLESNLPDTMLTAVMKGLHDPKTLELMRESVNNIC